MNAHDQEVRNVAFHEAAAICDRGVYNGDYYSSETDARDAICRWLRDEILKLTEEPK